MVRPVLADGRGNDVIPASEEELVSALKRFDATFREEREPRIAVIQANPDNEDTPKLSIGLGADESTLVYDEGDQGAYSQGPRTGDDTEVGYAYGDGYSEFLGWTLVSKDAAIAAAREFFRTGRRPTNVAWKDL